MDTPKPPVSEKPIDRRTLRTRRRLRDALLSLTLEKGYDAVTVEDITDRADLGRTTFYLHFGDKETLFLSAIDNIANELVKQVDLSTWNSTDFNKSQQPVYLAFRHAAANAQLYRLLLQSEVAKKATHRIRTVISESAKEYLGLLGTPPAQAEHPPQAIPAGGGVDAAYLQLMADFFASSLLGVMTWWLENNMPTPPDEMAAFVLQMYLEGARQTYQKKMKGG